jgi:hypothetical protein
MDWTKKITQVFKKQAKNNYPITLDSFLDVHNIYDKDDFIFDWKKLLESNPELWQQALKNSAKSKKILTVTLGGGFSHRCIMTIDTLISMALTLRGAKVETLTCDHAVPICLKAEYAYVKPEVFHHAQISQTLCKGCYKDTVSLSLQLGFTNHNMSRFVTLDERQKAHEIAKNIDISKIGDYHIDGINIGKHAVSSAIRYFAHSTPASLPLGNETLKRYLEAAIISYYAFTKLIAENNYDSVFLAQGLYIPHGIVKEICEHRGIPVVCWSVSNMKNRFLVARGEILHNMLYEPTNMWEDFQWGDAQEKKIMSYLDTRWSNKHDWVPITKDNINIPFVDFAKTKGIDLEKPIIGLLTNLIWEAFAEYKSRCFPDMLTWIRETIEFFAKRKDLQLLIRIHPAEKMWNASRQFVYEEIRLMFPKLPANIFIIEPTENINTYEAMNQCDSVLIYQTQTGIELAAMQGKSIIVAGDAWIRNKGVAYEPATRDEYFGLLNQLPLNQSISQEKTNRARKYSYHAFYRMMIPLSFFEETKDWMLFKPTLKNLDELLPNRDKGLDVICDGILNGTPFIYPAEEYDQESIY